MTITYNISTENRRPNYNSPNLPSFAFQILDSILGQQP